MLMSIGKPSQVEPGFGHGHAFDFFSRLAAEEGQATIPTTIHSKFRSCIDCIADSPSWMQDIVALDSLQSSPFQVWRKEKTVKRL